MTEVLRRWRAGHSDWFTVAPYEIVLERTPLKWLLTYLVHGERHARIGFDNENEALRNVRWLKDQCPDGPDAWAIVEGQGAGTDNS